MLDPVTNDLLFDGVFSVDAIIEVQGFAAPVATPEPSAFVLMAAGVSALAAIRRRMRVA